MGNIEHIGRRGYTPAEIEDAFDDPDRRVVAVQFRLGEMRFVLIATPTAGHLLTIPYTRRMGRVRPISAYPAKGRNLRRYERRAR